MNYINDLIEDLEVLLKTESKQEVLSKLKDLIHKYSDEESDTDNVTSDKVVLLTTLEFYGLIKSCEMIINADMQAIHIGNTTIAHVNNPPEE